MGLTVGTFCLSKGRNQGQNQRVLTFEANVAGVAQVGQGIKTVVENTYTNKIILCPRGHSSITSSKRWVGWPKKVKNMMT